ncbi:hypothetical protein C5167_029478 [Papaver somniferum]|nr:hypothetical protein C5167_029478 [Papaver somniferum]
MECNKVEAIRAKELALKKMNSKDYVGARRMLVKSQKLYPSVENVSRMLTVCQVHCSAERKVELGSDPDWYDILQIDDQTADNASIKKRFRKLALQLHPDKNRLPGAEAAFKLIEEAQRILCDLSKRSQFDIKRSTMQQKQSQKQQQTQPVYSNGLFWTQCPFCGIRYHRDIMNRAPRCRSCMKPFVAYNMNKQGKPSGVNNNQPLPKKEKSRSQASQKKASQAPTTSGMSPKPPGTKNKKRGRNSEPVVSVEVVDADFYEFNRDNNSEECFALDQTWAIYDDLDGMPRFYARIDKVYYPFKVDLTWLKFLAGDQDQTAWRRNGLPVACGKFEYGKTDTIKEIRMFSHKMIGEKGVGITYKIYHRKGETWALYKNWNFKWTSDPDNPREYEYEFVVVMSDYINESGILVAQLVKLKCFVRLFKPTETNGMSSFKIPSNEMLKFSHRVPSFRTDGTERKDVPEGYFELDPASLPSNLEEVSDFIDGKDETVDGNSSRMSNGCWNNVNEETL